MHRAPEHKGQGDKSPHLRDGSALAPLAEKGDVTLSEQAASLQSLQDPALVQGGSVSTVGVPLCTPLDQCPTGRKHFNQPQSSVNVLNYERILGTKG